MTWWVLAAVALLVPAVAVTAACGSSASAGCQTDNDCKGARVCQAGMCVDATGSGPTGASAASTSSGSSDPCHELVQEFCACCTTQAGVQACMASMAAQNGGTYYDAGTEAQCQQDLPFQCSNLTAAGMMGLLIDCDGGT